MVGLLLRAIVLTAVLVRGRAVQVQTITVSSYALVFSLWIHVRGELQIWISLSPSYPVHIDIKAGSLSEFDF